MPEPLGTHEDATVADPQTDTRWEYGVWSNVEQVVHRRAFAEQDAVDWIAEWIEMGGRPDTFSIVRRELGPWLPVAASPAGGR